MGLDPWELILRLGMAALLGGVIGLEREAHNRPAGLRTHILVCVGSALVILVSMYGFLEVAGYTGEARYDPARLAAQVVSGIGFLGAGTILREGATVRGLTTAATLWIVAGIGLAVGTGLYMAALVSSSLVMLTLMFLGRIERRWLSPGIRSLSVVIEDRPGQLAAVSSVLGRHQLNIKAIDIGEKQHGRVGLTVTVQAPGDEGRVARVLEEISRLEGVSAVSFGEQA